MRRTLMKSKIHRATVTGADLHYEGSVSVDPVLLEAADLVPHERVEIYNVTNGERFATYTIVGERGTGELTVNGAAAHKARAGDLVILVSYADYDEAEVETHRPVVVRVDGRNRIVGTEPERAGVRAAG